MHGCDTQSGCVCTNALVQQLQGAESVAGDRASQQHEKKKKRGHKRIRRTLAAASTSGRVTAKVEANEEERDDSCAVGKEKWQ